ncbi:MAG: hypothetical protein BMS9Abin20_0536 [Acidimicrobiia bacterium]|nr:MAG: hypothetical protein BMS9Abin20_0536 [Acidimicrobiia bacterium]
MWRRKPPRPHKAHLVHLGAIVALVLYANVVANGVLAEVWDIPFNLGVLGVALLIARRAGTTWTSMGLRSDRLRKGLVVGGAVIGVIAVGIAIAIVVPSTRGLFEDDRVIDNSVGWVLFQAFVRVPLATALYEEVLFRGIIFGMLARRYSPLLAAVYASALFGLWHILPTIDTLGANPAGGLFAGVIGLVIALSGAVGGTFLAGLAFLWVRLYANSTAAPVLAHIGTNSTAFIGALIVVHLL